MGVRKYEWRCRSLGVLISGNTGYCPAIKNISLLGSSVIFGGGCV